MNVKEKNTKCEQCECNICIGKNQYCHVTGNNPCQNCTGEMIRCCDCIARE